MPLRTVVPWESRFVHVGHICQKIIRLPSAELKIDLRFPLSLRPALRSALRTSEKGKYPDTDPTPKADSLKQGEGQATEQKGV